MTLIIQILIYVHERTDKTMLGTLKKGINNRCLNNINNYVIKISTETENSLRQVFSVYHIPTTNDYLQTDFSDDTAYQNFLDMIKNRSSHNFNTNVAYTENIHN